MTKTRFVLQDSSDRSPCIAGKRRELEETDKDKCEEGTANSSWRTGATSSRKKLDFRMVLWRLGARTIAGLQEANHLAVGRKVKEEMHKAPGRENEKLKAMKRVLVQQSLRRSRRRRTL